LITVGETVEEAAWWFITMDRSCQAQLLAEAAGVPVKIDHSQAIATRYQLGNHLAGWFQFQPLLARIIRDEPDLLD
jgi:ribulose-5-phosphate 4-epimerase/fuculose-1-phosphate aldolase